MRPPSALNNADKEDVTAFARHPRVLTGRTLCQPAKAQVSAERCARGYRANLKAASVSGGTAARIGDI